MSFIFVTPQVTLARNAGALYNYGLGTETMASLASTPDLNGLLNSVYVNSIGSTATSQVAKVFVANLGIKGDSAVKLAEDYVVAQLNSVVASGRGKVINDILIAFSGLTEDATFGAFATAWNAKVAAAVAYASKPGSTDVTWDVATSAGPAQTFYMLTPGIDIVTGSAGNDTFDGSVNNFGVPTLTAVDSLNGGTGTDTLIAANVGGALTLSAIEQLRFLGNPPAGVAIDFFGITGATSVSLENGTAATALSNLDSTSIGLTISNQAGAAAGTTLNFANAALAGAADSLAVKLVAVNAGNGLTINQLAGANTSGLASLTLDSSGSASNILGTVGAAAGTPGAAVVGQVAGVAANVLSSVTVTGSAPLTLNGSLQAGVLNFDASAASGGVTATLGAPVAVAGRVVSVTGGAGNDTFTVDAVGANLSVVGGTGSDTVNVGALGVQATDTLTGGDGTDTLRTGVPVAAAAAVNVTGFETLRLDAQALGGPFTQSAAAIAGLTAVQVAGAAGADAFTVSNHTAQTFTVRAAAAVDTLTITPSTDTSGDAVALTLNFGTSTAGVTLGQLTVDQYETVSITAAADTANSANAVNQLNGTVLKTLNVTNNSAGALTITNAAGTAYGNLTTVDGTNSTGGLVLFNAGVLLSTAATISGGSAADVITGSTSSDSISGNGGADNITGGGGNDRLDGGDGADTLTGAGGNDVISGGAGDDSITAGAGNDSLVGGDGAEVFVIATTANNTTQLTANDTIDGGDGTDFVQLVYAGAHAINFAPQTEARFTNVRGLEGIQLTIGAAANTGASLALGDIMLGSFGNSITINHSAADIARAAFTAANTVDASAVINNSAKVTYTGDGQTNTYRMSNGIDVVNLGAGNDFAVVTNPLFLQATDTLNGGAGADALAINAGAAAISISTATLANVAGFETITANFAAASLGGLTFTLADSFATANRNAANGDLTIGVVEGGGVGALTVNGAAVLAGTQLLVTSSGRTDSIVGGAGDDTVTFGAGNLNIGETVTGGDGTDTLEFTGDNSLTGPTVSGFEKILFNNAGGAVALTGLVSVFNGQTFAVVEDDAVNDVNRITLAANGTSVIDFSRITTAAGTVNGTTAATAFSLNDQIIVDLGAASNLNLANTYTGSALADSVIGGGLADTISGGAGADTIDGGVGDDRLTGGAGADLLTGGVGADTFVFAAGASGFPSTTNFDEITDPFAGADVIDFGGFALTADAGTGTGLTVNANGLVTAGAASLAAFITALGTSTSTTAGSTLIYNDITDSYLFISDGTAGLGASDVLVKLTGLFAVTGATFTNGDITLVA